MGKYNQIIKQQLLNELRRQLQVNASKEEWNAEWALSPQSFHAVGDRTVSGYNCSVTFVDGRCTKLTKSAVARGLRDVVEEDAQSSEYRVLYKGKTITMKIKSFVFIVECKTNGKKASQPLPKPNPSVQTGRVCPQEASSFPPLVDEHSEILILGTMPGEESIATGEYYAKKGNIFWEIMSKIFNGGEEFSTYKEKQECMHKNHIAIWDTLHSCSRKGSTDAAIGNEELNDIDNLLKQHPDIKRIVFNGQKALSYYRPSIPYGVALSTSPANRQYSDEERTESWRKELQHH